MRTRCPACDTVFRVTAEQLRLKAGKVRCGHCQSVFNAFDHLLPDSPAGSSSMSSPGVIPDQPPPTAPPPATPDSFAALTHFATERESASARQGAVSPVDLPEVAAVVSPPDSPSPALPPPPPLSAAPDVASGESADAVLAQIEDSLAPAMAEMDKPVLDQPPPAAAEVPPEPPLAPLDAPVAGALPDGESVETPEQSAQAARDAGLAAVRELAEAPGFNRWTAGTLASDDLAGFSGEAQRYPTWLSALVAGVLACALLIQLAYHFRSQIVTQWPTLGVVYRALAVDIPLARNPALVVIETSNLQVDQARGLFELNATLKNQAPHAQAWPALELTLTDINDQVVARRVIVAADYLSASAPAEAFPPNADIPVRLWIEASGLGAAGYRLYIFYP